LYNGSARILTQTLTPHMAPMTPRDGILLMMNMKIQPTIYSIGATMMLYNTQSPEIPKFTELDRVYSNDDLFGREEDAFPVYSTFSFFCR
jgi:hypothetical protein